MENRKSIDLLPEIPKEEVEKVQKKGKLNLFGVLSIFLVVFVSIIILLLNLFFRIDYNNSDQKLADTNNEVLGLQYVELKQKTLNTKMDTYGSVREHDCSTDVVLEYLLEVAEGLSSVSGIYLDDSMLFQITGKADSYINVARLWHDMAQDEDYFEYVNLESVHLVDGNEEANDKVTYSFSGKMIKENVDKL